MIESDTQAISDNILWINALVSAGFNCIIVSIVCWRVGRKPIASGSLDESNGHDGGKHQNKK